LERPNTSDINMPKKILIVDDEVYIRELLTLQILESIDCEISEAENGLVAFELCKTNQFNLILCDYKMPIMDGLTFISSLKTQDNLNEITPIIVISSFVDSAKKAEFNFKNIQFMEKPIPMEVLTKKIASIIA